MERWHSLHGTEISVDAFRQGQRIYNLDGKRCIAIGGEYSVEKYHHLANNWGWWPDEQPLPAKVPHAVLAEKRFKMLLTVLFQKDETV